MRKSLFAVLLIILFFSCHKDESQNDIPYVPVDIVITIAQYPSLQSTPGWAYIPGGSKGIAVYRSTQTDFFAMERHCPYLPANGNQVSVDSSNLFLRDAVCGSKFYMIDGGSVGNGPATRGLKRYNISFDGSITLHIYN